jgi:uncharacterized membrane protein
MEDQANNTNNTSPEHSNAQQVVPESQNGTPVQDSLKDNKSTEQTANTTSLSGLKPNMAAALAYLLGFISGAYFFVTYKDKFVRFHALQSIITSVALLIVVNILGDFLFFAGIFNILILVFYGFLMYQAYLNKLFKLPFIGDFAEKHA